MKENFAETIAAVLQEEETRGISIGEGRTALISIISGRETVCLKTIRDKKISANRAHAEMRFLDELADGEPVAPRPICSIETDECDYLFMETIKGFSVKDLIEKDLYARLPENFDFNLFFAALTRIIQSLHERRIHHRDLHAGNVMVNLENPNAPVIIDFGDATRQFLSSEDPYRENIRGKLIVFPDDLEKIRALRLELEQYLTRKKGAEI